MSDIILSINLSKLSPTHQGEILSILADKSWKMSSSIEDDLKAWDEAGQKDSSARKEMNGWREGIRAIHEETVRCRRLLKEHA